MVTALYRRYRPEAFAEMIGQSQVTDPLMTALRAERIGHAYLFSGPRGCGKTTSARILARCLNCAEGPTDTPCGRCPSCVDLSREGGGSLDVVEIDAASHGGVDDARELRERAVFAPARDRYKIFIIDEAHMVTPGGFNALLKIVEEPPPHVKFVFATTEPEKVIGTIRSRTHHYPFRLVPPAPLIEYVQSLCDSEGVEVESGVLPLIIRAGGGSVRDTLSILDQLIAGSENGHVSLDRAAGLLGFTHTELLDEVVAAFGAHDAAAAFAATDRVVQTGQDPRRFAEDLLQRLRDLIVVSATSVQGAAAVFRGVPEDQLQRMFEQAQAFGRGELSRIADTVSSALDRMAGATSPKLQLELMIARAILQGEAQSGQQAATPTQAPSPAQAPAAQATVPAAAPATPSAPTAPSAPSTTPAAPSTAASASADSAPATHAPAAQPTANQTPVAQPSVTQPPAAQPPASSPPSAQPNAEVSAAEAMRAAREFLRNDTAGAAGFGRPVTDVIGMMQDQGVEEATSQSETSSAPLPLKQAEGETGVSFSDIEGAWPELLEELLETNRDAWNAVQGVVPLGLEGDLFSLAFRSRSDFEVFKSQGAGPLREAILGALGITVRYQPRDLPAQIPPHAASASKPAESPTPAPQAPTRQTPAQQTPAQQAPLPNAPAPQASAAAPTETAETTEPADLTHNPAAALGPVGAAPAWADYRPEQETQPGHDDDDPYAGTSSDPYTSAAQPEPAAVAAAPELEPEPEPAAAPASVPAAAPETPTVTPETPVSETTAPESSAAGPPAFTRYGEAVVREVLGARFVGEKPLPTDEGM